MIATVHLNFAVDISPVFHVVPKGYDISSSTAVFELRDKNGDELYAESATGITVEAITLTAPLKYADGTKIDSGTEVEAIRVSPDLSSLSLGDPENINVTQYRYGLRVDNAWMIQGWWNVWPDTGPAGFAGNMLAVCCGPVQIAVNVFGVNYSHSEVIVIGDTVLPASEEIKGMARYKEPIGGGSVFSVCMRKKDGTYGWVDIVEEV